MKKEIRDRWVAALRSGDYRQGYGALHTPDRYCALGVLCDLADKAGGVVTVEDHGYFKYDGKVGFPPLSVDSWSGLEDDFGASGEVARLNDQRFGFHYIADWIEKNL